MIKIAVSRCLLGEPVRYDGGHKQNLMICDRLKAHFDLIGICPEVEAGLGVPRLTLNLQAVGDHVRVVQMDTGLDVTPAIDLVAAARLAQIPGLGVRGMILKSRSPSCGLAGLKVYSNEGRVLRETGQGRFAARLTERFPNLPVIDEEGLSDGPRVRRWLAKVLVYDYFKSHIEAAPSQGTLVAVHTDLKYAALAYSETAYRKLGPLVASGDPASFSQRLADYEKTLLSAIDSDTSVSKTTNVLQHMQGFFRKVLDKDALKDLDQVIAGYAAGQEPINVPISLLEKYAKAHGIQFIERQVFLWLRRRLDSILATEPGDHPRL